MTRRPQLEVEHLGVNAVEALAVREGLSVARPMWDDDGIDLIVYTVADGRLKAVGVQVKAYRNTTWRIDTKYPTTRVMAYVWHAADPGKQRMFVLTARRARAIAKYHTVNHNTRHGRTYDPKRSAYWTTPAAPKDLQRILLRHEIGAQLPATLRAVCGLE